LEKNAEGSSEKPKQREEEEEEDQDEALMRSKRLVSLHGKILSSSFQYFYPITHYFRIYLLK